MERPTRWRELHSISGGNYHEVDKLRIKSLSHPICQVDSSSEAFQAAAQGAFDNFYRWGVTAKGCMVDDHDVP